MKISYHVITMAGEPQDFKGIFSVAQGQRTEVLCRSERENAENGNAIRMRGR
jgi:hypothetical protein